MSVITRTLCVSRSNLYEITRPKEKTVRIKNEDTLDLIDIKNIVDERPSYGYRRVTAVLRRKRETAINHKRVYRIMREHKLTLAPYGRRPTRMHKGKIITLRSNTRWCSDGFRIQCWNGEHVEVAFSLDCCDREALSWVCSTRGIDGGLVRDLMVQSIEHRFGRLSRLQKRSSGLAITVLATQQTRPYLLEENLVLKS